MDKLYDMGRFYQIMDTGNIPPMWGQHNINTNLQVCAGNNTGLFDEMDVYFRFYETKLEDFRTNARKLFGARGLLCSVHCDYDSGLFYHFSKTYPHYAWTGCLGWIYNELWGYWLVTGDRAFLRDRLVPVLKEIALFFEDYACDRGPDGRVIFYPSFSPENPTPNPDFSTVTCRNTNPTRINSVMDIAICREVLDNLISACQTLNIEQESIPQWEAQRESLPTYLLDGEGALKEWSWPTIEENYNHRHVSHHYDLWPGRAVTPEREPALARAIRLSNRKRGQQDDSAHGIIHRCLSAIRLKDVDEAMQNLTPTDLSRIRYQRAANPALPLQGPVPRSAGWHAGDSAGNGGVLRARNGRIPPRHARFDQDRRAGGGLALHLGEARDDVLGWEQHPRHTPVPRGANTHAALPPALHRVPRKREGHPAARERHRIGLPGRRDG